MDYKKLNEDELLTLVKEQDDAALLELIARYQPLLAKETRAAYLKNVADNAELASIARLAFIEAVYSYDKALGSFFAGYAKGRVHDALYTEFRRTRRDWENTLHPDQLADADSFWEILGGSESIAHRVETAALITQAISILTPAEKRLLELIYYAEVPQKNIAQELNKSHQWITKLKNKILAKMRAELAPLSLCYSL